MTRAHKWLAPLRGALSVLALAGLVSWSLTRQSDAYTALAGLAGVIGVLTFAASLTPAFWPGRHRTRATGALLVATATVLASLREPVGTRTAFLVLSGAVLFCALELSDRPIRDPRGMERLPGADPWRPAAVLALTAGASALSYAAVSARSALGGGGPAGLAAGTIAAVLVAFLALALARRARAG